MSWAAPVAFAGLALLALPVLVHLMGAGRPVVRRFPSLRFITETRLPPVRRKRIHDLPLLALRLLALAAAVFALARPQFESERPAAGATLARAVIVDTGRASQAEVAARIAAADSASAGADLVSVVRTRDPSSVIAGAAAWLESQPGRRELVVVSDFRVGSVDSADVAAVPAWAGVRLVRAGALPGGGNAVAFASDAGGRRVTVRTTVEPGRTDVTWTGGARAQPGVPVRFAGAGASVSGALARAVAMGTLAGATVSGAAPRAGCDSIVLVALDAGSSPARGGGSVARRTTDGDAVIRAAPCQGDLIARLHLDPAVLRVAGGFGASVVRDGERGRVEIATPAGPASAATVALASAAVEEHGVRDAGARAAMYSDSALASWQRAAREVRQDGRAENSTLPARLLWALALLALAAELWLRLRIQRGAAAARVADGAR
ncbi:MAG: BatA domain-containing protein [Gemmatimonadaceae bacterium]|nr:BatA domain-containing protein [Gemmatimonadaceae bacterium]